MSASAAASGAAEADLSKSERAYQWMKERITRQVFTPGYRLVLVTIADELDMSVVPVREAIRQLEAESLVTFERNVGAHVSMIDDTQYRDSMQTLSIIEGAATALAARRLSADDIARARAVNRRMVESLRHFDPHTFTELNRQFHATLFDACPNARMVDVVRSEWARLGQLRDSTFSFVPGRAGESVNEHEAILVLIEQRDPLDQIETAARRHRSSTLDACLNRKHPNEPATPALS